MTSAERMRKANERRRHGGTLPPSVDVVVPGVWYRAQLVVDAAGKASHRVTPSPPRAPLPVRVASSEGDPEGIADAVDVLRSVITAALQAAPSPQSPRCAPRCIPRCIPRCRTVEGGEHERVLRGAEPRVALGDDDARVPE